MSSIHICTNSPSKDLERQFFHAENSIENVSFFKCDDNTWHKQTKHIQTACWKFMQSLMTEKM